jgi:hypothetical protein
MVSGQVLRSEGDSENSGRTPRGCGRFAAQNGWGPGNRMNVRRIAQWVRAAPTGLPCPANSLSQDCASLVLGYPLPVPPGRNIVGEDDLQSSILTVNGFATGVSTAAVTVAVLDTPKQYVTR